MATEITDAELQQLLSEGLSQNEIAKRIGIPRSTLQRRFQELGVPKGHKGVPLLTWWRERKLTVQMKDDPEQETERKTYHVQKRYIEAIQRAADLERVSITEIVNRAFKQFFDDER